MSRAPNNQNKKPRKPPLPIEAPWHFETLARGRGDTCIAGIDEAGRGPLAGPVVAAAVVLPENFDISGIADSKKLTALQRETAYQRIVTECAWAVGIAEADEIDRINILKATHAAMRRALAALPEPAHSVFVDGLPVPSLHNNCLALVQGDARCVSISAASIVAKVTRDRLLVEADARWPLYGFARHKGYASPEHLAAIREFGPCPLHRRSFAPLSQATLAL